MQALVNLFDQLHWYDFLDILVVTYIVVWLYSRVKGTRAFRVLLGQAFLIFVIVIFAPELRQVLERLNPLRAHDRIHHAG